MRITRPLILASLAFQAGSAWSQMTTAAGTSMIVDSDTHLRIDGPWTWSVEGGASLQNDGLIELGIDALLNEVPGSPVFGAGVERIERNYGGSLANEDPGGLGLRMSTSISLGATITERGHLPFTDYSGHTSIARWYRVDPSLNSGLNATIELGYDPTELNGLAEIALIPHIRYAPDIWYPFAGTVNTGSHFISSAGLDSLGTFTAFDDDLPNVMAGTPAAEQARLVPNAGEHVELVLPFAIRADRIHVIDARGAIVRRIDPVARAGSIDLHAESLAPGLYLVHIGGANSALRFIR